jgi:D-arabinono-1,4-lactone oxidase
LYSQFVNEWAVPLEKGPEAITRLSAWINGDEATARIPVSVKGVYVHCPIEVRVTHTGLKDSNHSGVRPYLDPTIDNGSTLYLNATLYRPYGRDPPCHEVYYEAFEYLMREIGGKPHWAKNFTSDTASAYLSKTYGKDMDEYMKTRDESDPDGMFLGQWHTRNLPLRVTDKSRLLREEEVQRTQRGLGRGFGDAVLWEGRQAVPEKKRFVDDLETDKKIAGYETPSPPTTATSEGTEESFDYMAKGEASVYASN